MLRIVEKIKNVKLNNIIRCAFALVAVLSILLAVGTLNEYNVIDGENSYRVVTGSKDVNSMLLSAGISLDGDDIVTTLCEDNNNTVIIDRSYSQVITPETKLAAAEITENVMSYTDEIIFGSVSAAVPLSTDGDGTANIKQLMVEYSYETVTQTVKFGYKTTYSKELEKGKTAVKKGSNGEKQVVFRQKTVGGVVVEREIVSEEITKQPVAQVETIGTKIKLNSANAVQTSEDIKCISTLVPSKPIELDANGVPVNYVDIITGKGSAYSDGNCTSTGVAARPGYVAVNPKQIPYGTKMYIVSADGRYVYGYAVAADTGGFATNGSGRIVDLRFNTSEECWNFGVREVIIYILPD